MTHYTWVTHNYVFGQGIVNFDWLGCWFLWWIYRLRINCLAIGNDGCALDNSIARCGGRKPII